MEGQHTNMKDTFSEFHPIINLSYFLAVIISTMLFFDVYFLPISFVAAFSYALFIGGGKFIKMFLIFVPPIVLLSTVINMYTNQAGDTVLFQIGYRVFTWEAMTYGLMNALMFTTIIIWFYTYNAVVTSDKFLYVFGKIIPTLALVFSMVLRFVPLFTKRAKLIATGQKCIGKDIGTGTKKEKTRHGIKILSIMVSWSLENSIDTSDSMKARGYGLKGRTSYNNFTFSSRDLQYGIIVGTVTLITFWGIPNMGTYTFYYPYIEVIYESPIWYLVYTCSAILCFLPLLINLGESIRWKYLKSKI